MELFKHANEQMLNNVLLGVRQKFPLLDTVLDSLQFAETDKISTCATDSQIVLYNPKFFENLTYDQRVFALSHEILHVAFDHILRSKDKEKTDWNIATDAVINKILKDNGLPTIDGCVDMDDALGKSAEEMYEKIHGENKSKPEQSQGKPSGDADNQNTQPSDKTQTQSNNANAQQSANNQQNSDAQQNSDDKKDNQSNSQNSGSNDKSNDDTQAKQPSVTNHDMWEEAVKKFEQDQIANKKRLEENQTKKKNQTETIEDSKNKDDEDGKSNFEKEFARKNQEKKEEIGKELIKQLKEHLGSKGSGKGGDSKAVYTFGDVGKSDKAFSWKTILKRYIDDEISMYSYRRADEDNYFQARVEDLEQFEKPWVEVMLDTSYSVPDSLLKEFLRQLKHLIKDTKLMVGCFSYMAYDFVEIKKMSDIDNFKIQGRNGTDFNCAARAFTWKGRDAKDIYRIIFTDGEATFTLTDKRYKKLIWVVYDNTNFKTDYGKVIYVKSKDIMDNKALNLEIEQ